MWTMVVSRGAQYGATKEMLPLTGKLISRRGFEELSLLYLEIVLE